jgi:hypothetical protein
VYTETPNPASSSTIACLQDTAPPDKLLKQSTVWSQLQITLDLFWLLQIN